MPAKKETAKPLRLVIIGSGIAGHSACRAALDAVPGVEVVMITKEVTPPYSPCVLPYYLAGEIPRESIFLPTDYRETENVRFMMGTEVVAIDREQKTLLLENDSVPYDRLILALGGHSVTLPLPGVNLPGIFHCKTVEDADALMAWPGKKAVVVGSGPIGVEVAAALNMRGIKVTIIELMDRLLPVILDTSSACIVADTLTADGIEVLLSERVQSIKGQDHVEAVVTDKREVPADMVVLAAGMRPAVELARKAGLEIGQKGGIVTDRYLRTSDPDIWACGDCIQSYDILTGLPALSMLWPNARIQGALAGINAVGEYKIYQGSSSSVTVNLFETFIFSFGSPSHSGQDFTVRERTTRKGHIRVVAKDNILAGVQVIGDDSWAGITSALANPHMVTDIKVKPSREDLVRQTPLSRRLIELVGDMIK